MKREKFHFNERKKIFHHLNSENLKHFLYIGGKKNSSKCLMNQKESIVLNLKVFETE